MKLIFATQTRNPMKLMFAAPRRNPRKLLFAVPPRNPTKAEYLETRTDEQFFQAIKFGGLSVGRAPCMPAWGNTLSDSIINELVRYIRELCQCEAL